MEAIEETRDIRVNDMESGHHQQVKSVFERLYESYQPTVTGIASECLTRLENVGEYLAHSIGITSPKYEWETMSYFENQQGISYLYRSAKAINHAGLGQQIRIKVN